MKVINITEILLDPLVKEDSLARFSKKHHVDKERSLMRVLVVSLVYYPEMLAVSLVYSSDCPILDSTVGSRRHSYLSTIIILLQNDVGGLNARDQEQWILVTPIKGALIVNVEDTLQILSNGNY
ncbi:2-oxoglutarate (2OG) and Fe(II)-dependent oxygenase superfamily protein [Striga hermonthica]|uniref:2-oxoglutarate (2OG) and Fe(II)-dependent oxygenase superfamily protein n=1 Tax=Striga hermonthica TaxID=68872 RepID=A0A9N7MY55_STRHE|nr:2-oxoglutarate (2OG) and Fe(II)-dependent oxygenase superfamily protein [Striga hermonthica]